MNRCTEVLTAGGKHVDMVTGSEIHLLSLWVCQDCGEPVWRWIIGDALRVVETVLQRSRSRRRGHAYVRKPGRAWRDREIQVGCREGFSIGSAILLLLRWDGRAVASHCD